MGRFSGVKGYAQETKTILCNNGYAVAGSGFAVAADGTLTLAKNLSSKTAVYPISGLHVGDVISGFRICGALGGTSGKATVVDADLRKVLKAADVVTDASVGAITQVSVEADTALYASKTGLRETVAKTYQYYVLVTVSTADDNACTMALTGVEVDLNKR